MPHTFYDTLWEGYLSLSKEFIFFLPIPQQNVAVNVYTFIYMWTWEAYLISVFVVHIVFCWWAFLDMTSVWSHLTYFVWFDTSLVFPYVVLKNLTGALINKLSNFIMKNKYITRKCPCSTWLIPKGSSLFNVPSYTILLPFTLAIQ